MPRILYKRYFKFPKALKIHVLCWSVFIIYEVFVSSTLYGFYPFLQYVLFYILNIGTFYLHADFLLNRLTNKPISNIFRISTFTIAEILAYFILSLVCTSLLNKFIYHKNSAPTIFDFKYFTYCSYRGIYFTLYGTGYYFLINYLRKQEKTLTQAVENERLQTELLRAEQDFLRAQINPHLLFNTLSFIKYAARKKPEEANEAIMRLSGIMSFALENNAESILITKELEQVENIIGLNQLRFNHTLNINYVKELENTQATIIPIILLTLVENIFKHGNLMDKDHPAGIYVMTTNDYILLQTSNLPNRNTQVISTNKGLANISSRLDQMYKNTYEFKYGMDNNLFKVDIRISLQKL